MKTDTNPWEGYTLIACPPLRRSKAKAAMLLVCTILGVAIAFLIGVNLP